MIVEPGAFGFGGIISSVAAEEARVAPVPYLEQGKKEQTHDADSKHGLHERNTAAEAFFAHRLIFPVFDGGHAHSGSEIRHLAFDYDSSGYIRVGDADAQFDRSDGIDGFENHAFENSAS